MSARILAILVALAAVSISATSAADLKLAAFNLEHLAEHNGEGCRPRNDADYDAMRSYISSLGADVIAFSEVENEAAAARVFPASEYTIAMEHRPDAGGSPCRENPALSIRRQAVGFAVKSGVVFTRNPDYTALSLGNNRLRRGVDITVRQPVRLRLLAVHLKSGCVGPNNSNDPDCPTLSQQRLVLERWIDRRARGNRPFVVLGDFNHHLARTSDWFWQAIDDAAPANANLSLAEGATLPACDPQFTQFIDHIVLDKRATGKLLAGSFEEHVYSAAHLSDHCAISVLLRF